MQDYRTMANNLGSGYNTIANHLEKAQSKAALAQKSYVSQVGTLEKEKLQNLNALSSAQEADRQQRIDNAHNYLAS